MIVNCPECSTKFNLDESKVPADGAWVRCSKCETVFEIKPEGAETEVDLGQAPPEQPTAPGPKPDAPRPHPSDGPDLDISNDLEAAAQASRGGGFSIVYWIIGGLLLAILVAVGGLLVMDRMGLGGDIVAGARKLPVLGAILKAVKVTEPEETAAERATKMGLNGVRGFFRINEKAGRVFIIQGRVENNHVHPQASIRVRGRLHDAKGRVVRAEVVYAGPIFSAEDLRQFSVEQMRARLAKPTDPNGDLYVLPPGNSLPFIIIFTDLPGNLTEFTAEVVGSEVYKRPEGDAKKS